MQEDVDDESGSEPKTPRKQSSPKPYHGPESPSQKKRKMLSLEEASSPEHKSPMSLMKPDFDFYGGDSQNNTKDQRFISLSNPIKIKSEGNLDISYSDDNTEMASEIPSDPPGILNILFV